MLKHSFIRETEKNLTEILTESALKGKTILAGLSGGADSVSLVCTLCALSEKYGFRVSACHINHMIRGDEADRDEEFAKALCQRLGIPFYSRKYDVPTIAKETKKSLEEAARDIRYSYFDELCENGAADYIATAHTASDNAETLLFNITRGCGISGLCAIPKRRGRIIRPLLSLSRQDVEDYLDNIGESYVTDSTNLVCDCSRNIIRLKVIPELCRINPAFHRQASRLSTISERENEYLDSIARSSMTDNLSALAQLDRVILSRVIGILYKEKTGYLPGMDHIDNLCDEIYRSSEKSSGEKKSFDLPGGISVRFECGKLIMRSIQEEKTYTEYDFELTEGITSFCNGEMLVVCEMNHENNKGFDDKTEYNQNIYSLFMQTRLFSDIIKGKIHLRSGISGDKIRISGMSKDVRKMYSAKRIPVDLRRFLPRIVDSATGEILSLPYVGVCDSQHEHWEKSDIFIKLYILQNKE